jgi:hypothetical protein
MHERMKGGGGVVAATREVRKEQCNGFVYYSVYFTIRIYFYTLD